jgi:hypothetical protein
MVPERRIRAAAWAAFSLVMIAGIIFSFFTHDAMGWARTGSVWVIICIGFARWRYMKIGELERYFERSLRNPARWFYEALEQQLPGMVQGNPPENSDFSRDDVAASVDRLVSEIDKITFRDEAFIIIFSTIIWGFGDLVLLKFFPLYFPH